MRSILIAVAIAAVLLLANCSKQQNNETDLSQLGALPLTVQSPADNPGTTGKIETGRMLFWDPILSGSRDVACASCHHPSLGYTDNLDLAIGSNGTGLGTARRFNQPNDIPFTKRNTPTIVNTAFNGITANGHYDPANAAMFFDNRVAGLELQCQQPIKTLEEMMGHRYNSIAAMDSIVNRIRSIPAYVQLFKNAFPGDSICAATISKAIAAYERTIVANNTAFDRYMRGDAAALTTTQVQGLDAFFRSGCAGCHNGPMFSDYQLHVLSVPDNNKLPTDAGANNAYAFRTASLRNLPLTAPYMHNGVFASLQQVLDFYEQVGDGQSQNVHVAKSSLDNKLRPINDRDKSLIIQFLQSLSDNSFDKTIPAAVPSGLHPGGNL